MKWTAYLLLLLTIWIFYSSSVFADTIYSNTGATINQASPGFSSGAINASAFENLIFSFDYVAETLDATTVQDFFVYGWRAGSTDNDLGTFNGINEGSTGDETGSINISLPAGAQVADLSLYINVTVNSGSDAVVLSNILLSGTPVAATTSASASGQSGSTGSSRPASNEVYTGPSNSEVGGSEPAGEVLGATTVPDRETRLKNAELELISIMQNFIILLESEIAFRKVST